MRVIIAGGRDFDDYTKLCWCVGHTIWDAEDVEIVSGGAKGADALGEKYAGEQKFKLTRFPAEWDRYGKSAGYRRNEEMAKYAHELIAFWDGRSKGTKHMIDLALEHGLTVHVFRYQQKEIVSNV